MDFAVIDYGLGNLRSVSKALEFLGAKVKVTSSAADIAKARACVLPGVGAFGQGMKNINKLGLAGPIRDAIDKGKPFLGICLGLQLLFTESDEHGRSPGLDIINGKVERFSGADKIPHMGWNAITIKEIGGIFTAIPDQSYFYFVHSYYVVPKDAKTISATTDYGVTFTAAVTRGNLFAVQFHPEKSAGLGMKILANFIKIASREN